MFNIFIGLLKVFQFSNMLEVLGQNGPPAPQDLNRIGKLENPKQTFENIRNNLKILENLSKN